MKNISTLFFALLFSVSMGSNLFAQGTLSDENVWSIVKADPNGNTKVEMPKWIPAPQIPRFYNIGDGITVDPNFRPHPTTNSTQSEVSIDVNPFDNNIVFCSANASDYPVSNIYGTGVYWSVDGAYTWAGTDNPGTLSGFGSNAGDPCSIIGPDGRLYENYISNSYGQGVSVSTNNGATWTSYTVAPNPGYLADKNHYMVDKMITSPYVNRNYCAFTDFSGANDQDAVFRYSTNFGQTWSSSINLSSGLTSAYLCQGVNIQTGPNGEVYATWAVYIGSNVTDGEDGIGFTKSTNGGVTWSTPIYAYQQTNFGIRTHSLPGGKGLRSNSFPSMAVDRSGGPYNGYIYITWPQRGVAPAGSDPDVVMIKSTDGGASWSSPVRVNDDALSNGKDQIFPWCTVDQATGQLMFVFYDSRNVANNQAEVFMATSLDGGGAFNNFVVSDQSFNLGPIPGFSDYYAGDYIGLAAFDNVAYPFWMDARTGIAQGWMAKVTFGPPCPIDPPSNPNPPNNATDLPLSGNLISWENGAGASQIEIWFGELGNLAMVYDGSPTTSLSLAPYEPFDYFTTYGWQIKEKNDTCTVSGPIWTFKTMQDPNLVNVTVDIYPQELNYWTGTCNSSSKNEVSLVNANGSGFAGWMVFDVSSIVNDPTTVIQEITFNGYLYANNWPYWTITPMGSVNPVTDAASAIYSQVSNHYSQGVAYSYNQESGTLTNGWIQRELTDGGAIADLQNSLSQGWFALGVYDWDAGTTFYVNFQGWAETNKPYLTVKYTYVVPVELTSFTASVNKTEVTLDWNTATETNNQGFDIERMSKGGQFEKIGFVAGFGTTTEPKSYTFTDSKLEAGNYTYRLKQVDFDGTFEYSNELNAEVTLPLEYTLEQNYPNPFNPSTTIKYSIPDDGFVKLAVYNMLGEEVANLVNARQKAGRYEINFNASNLSSGVYVYRLETPNFTSSKKLMLMK